MPRMVHPVTGGEFDAPDRAVAAYERSGWTVKDAAGGGQPAQAAGGKSKSAAAPSAGGPESAGE